MPQQAVTGRFDTWRNGSYAVWLDAERITVESVRDSPWVPARAGALRAQ